MQTPANAPTKVAEDVKSILLNRVVECTIFCGFFATMRRRVLHSIFIKFSLKQTFLSLSLVSLTLSSVASEKYDDDDEDDDDDDECFLRTMIKNNVLNVLLSEG